jgi:hypothetical protein
MRYSLIWLCTVLLLACVPHLPASAAPVPGVVGEGNPASCTEAALRTAINNVPSGITVTFNCGPNPVTIPTRRLDFFANREIDGGGRITLSGCVPTSGSGLICESNERIVAVAGGVSVGFKGITFADAFDRGSADGGCINVAANAQLYLTNVVLRNCQVASPRRGGAIWSAGRLELSNTVIESSKAANGGGIYIAAGSLKMGGGHFTGNTAKDGGGALETRSPDVLLTDVRFEANSADYGGGWAAINGGIVVGARLIFRDNRADFGGGAIYTYTTGSPNPLRLANTTLVGNQATYGGAIYVDGAGNAELTNVTLTQNTGTMAGGAIFVRGERQVFLGQPYITELALINVTIAGNSAPSGGGLAANDQTSFQRVALKNVVLDTSPQGGNCRITDFASSHSLSSDGTCDLSGPGDRNNLAALLGALDSNGGPTQTMLPMRGSPLIDGVGGSDCPMSDQRDVARPQGASCDIGAVEVQRADHQRAIYVPMVLR